MIINLPKLGPVRFADNLSDEEFQRQLQALSKKYDFQLPKEEVGLGTIFGRGAARSAKQMGSALFDVLPAMGASALGFEDYAKKQMEEAAQTQQEIAKNYPAQFKSYTEVESPYQALQYGVETLGELVPTALGAVVPGGIAGTVGRGIATRGAVSAAEKFGPMSLAERVIAKEAGEAVGKKAMYGGLYLGSYAQNTPEIFQNIYEETKEFEPLVAGLAGGLSSLLDSIVPGRVMDQLGMFGKLKAVEKMAKDSGAAPSVWKAIGKEAVKSAATEGLTESAQESISAIAEQVAGSAKDFLDPENIQRYKEAFVKGAIGGSAFGVIGGAGQGFAEKRAYEEQQAREAAAKAPPSPPQLAVPSTPGAPPTAPAAPAAPAAPKVLTPEQEEQEIQDFFKQLEEQAQQETAAGEPPAPPAPPAPTVVSKPTLKTITKIDDLKAFGKLFGIGPTAKILKPDSLLAGKDVTKPEDALVVKTELTRYASDKPAPGAAEKIQKYIEDVLDPVIKGAADAARIDTEAGGKGAGVPVAGGVPPGPAAPTGQVEPSRVDVAGSDVGELAGGKEAQPSALDKAQKEFGDVQDMAFSYSDEVVASGNTYENPVQYFGDMLTDDVVAYAVKNNLNAQETDTLVKVAQEAFTKNVDAQNDMLSMAIASADNVWAYLDSYKGDLEIAIDSNRQNLIDTMNEKGVKSPYVQEQVLAVFDAEVKKLKEQKQAAQPTAAPAPSFDESYEYVKQLALKYANELNNKPGFFSDASDALDQLLGEVNLYVEKFKLNKSTENALLGNAEKTFLDSDALGNYVKKPKQAAPTPVAEEPTAKEPTDAEKQLGFSDAVFQKIADKLGPAAAWKKFTGVDKSGKTLTWLTSPISNKIFAVISQYSYYEMVPGEGYSSFDQIQKDAKSMGVEDLYAWKSVWDPTPFTKSVLVKKQQAEPVTLPNEVKEKAKKLGGIYALDLYNAKGSYSGFLTDVTEAEKSILESEIKVKEFANLSLEQKIAAKQILLDAFKKKMMSISPQYNAAVEAGTLPTVTPTGIQQAEPTYTKATGQKAVDRKNILDRIDESQIKKLEEDYGPRDSRDFYNDLVGDLTQALALRIAKLGKMHITEPETRLVTKHKDVIDKILKSYLAKTDKLKKIHGPFNEANYRPSVVAWAKDYFKDSVAPNGQLTWQNFVQWFGNSQAVDGEGRPLFMYHGTSRDIKKFIAKQAKAIFVTEDPHFANMFADLSMSWVLNNKEKVLTPKQLETMRRKADKIADPDERRAFEDNYVVEKSGVGKTLMRLYVRAEKPFDQKNFGHMLELSKKPEFDKLLIESQGEPSVANIRGLLKRLYTENWQFIENPLVQDAIKAAKFDSFYMFESGPDGVVRNLAVYKESQIKSQTGNVGNFSLNSPYIMRADAETAALHQQADEPVLAALEKKDLPGALNALIASTNSLLLKRVARAVIGNIKDVKLVYGAEKSMYDPKTNTIYLTENATDYEILHEATHAALSHVLADPNNPVTKELLKLFNEMKASSEGLYGATDLQEFAAEAWSNEEFRSHLQQYKPDGQKFTGWERFLNAVRRIFGFLGVPKTETAADKIDQLLNEIVSPPPETRQGETLFAASVRIPNFGGKTFSWVDSGLKKIPSVFTPERRARMWGMLEKLALPARALAYKALTASQLGEVATKYFKQNSVKFANLLNEMEGYKEFLREKVEPFHDRLTKHHNDNPERHALLSNLINQATLNDISLYPVATDPTTGEVKVPSKYAGTDKEVPWRELYGQYMELTQVEKELYADNFATFKSLHDLFRKSLALNIKELVGDTDKAVALYSRMMNELSQVMIENYSPLYRPPGYRLAYKIDGIDYVQRFETQAERFTAQEELAKQGATDFESSSQIDQFTARTVPDGTMLASIMKIMKDAGAKEGDLDKLVQLVVSTFPETSMLQRFQHRTGIGGYINDNAALVFDRVASSTIRQIANTRYRQKIRNVLNQMEMDQAKLTGDDSEDAKTIFNDFNGRFEFSMNPNIAGWAQFTSASAFYWNLGANVSSAVVQVATLPTIVYPFLGGRYGWNQSWKAIKNAMALYSKSTISRDVEELTGKKTTQRAMLSIENLTNSGKSPEYAALIEALKLHGLLTNSTARDALYSENQNDSGFGGVNKLQRVTALYSSFLFHHTERMSREVTAVATYDLELSKLQEKNAKLKEEDRLSPEEMQAAAIQEAIRMTERTHGASTTLTGPALGQSNLGKVLMVFKRFAFAQYYNLFSTIFRALPVEGADPATIEDIRAARRQLTGIYVMATLFAGVKGIPLYWVAALAYDSLKEDDEDDFDAVARRYLGELLFKGPVNYLLNLSIADRVGWNDLIWRENKNDRADASAIAQYVESVLGAPYSILKNIFKGFDLIAQGHLYRGIEMMLPATLKNVMKGARYGFEGANTLRGDPVMGNVNGYNAAMQILGFAPADLMKQYEKNAYILRKQDKITKAEEQLLKQYYVALRQYDFERAQDMRERLFELGNKYPELGINDSMLNKSVASRDRISEKMYYGVQLNEKLRPRLEGAASLVYD